MKRRSRGRQAAQLLALALLLGACTMPLPQDLQALPSSAPPDGGNSSAGVTPAELDKIPTEQIQARPGTYNNRSVSYLDLNPCDASLFACPHLASPLSTLVRYDFFFSDGSPVIGQNPIFNTPPSAEADTPFRQVIRVIVPDGYRPNTIRSSQDVAASQFRTEASERVLNNPLLSSATGTNLALTIGKAWIQEQEVAYLDLGSAPFAPSRNELGFGFVYFLRNHDKSDLPTRPNPIFASIPGDLLYSPIRQVFRAVAENQISSVAEDPASAIHSEEDLLAAINQGVFRLEKTGDYFNFPIYQTNVQTPASAGSYRLSLAAASNFPPLPANAYYALWVTNQLNQARLILRFSGEGSTFKDLDGGKQLAINPNAPAIFRFSQPEIDSVRHFLITIEQGNSTQPTGSTLLEASYESREETELRVPFAANYAALQKGTYLLATPTDRNGSNQSSGIWLVERTDRAESTPPLARDLGPGLVMSLPPRGWTYNTWILTDLRNPVWLQLGRFLAFNQPDQLNFYGGNNGEPYPYPGEDLLTNAPPGQSFPLGLTSTGERELVVSLEPENLTLNKPYFSLYRTILLKGTPELTNQPLPVNAFTYPALRVKLAQE